MPHRLPTCGERFSLMGAIIDIPNTKWYKPTHLAETVVAHEYQTMVQLDWRERRASLIVFGDAARLVVCVRGWGVLISSGGRRSVEFRIPFQQARLRRLGMFRYQRTTPPRAIRVTYTGA